MGVGLPLLTAAITGNLGIPHNDAWAYSRIAETFGRTGTIRLLNWNRTSLIGQIVILGPFARSVVIQQLAVGVLAVATLVAVHRLVLPSVGPRRALLAVAIVAIWPGFASLATSFMTDVPYVAGAFGCVAIGRLALARDSRRLLALSLVVGLWAVTVREQAIAAPLAVLACGAFTVRTRERLDLRALVLAAAVLVACIAAFLVWRNGLPHGDHPHVGVSLGPYLGGLRLTVAVAYFTLSFGLAPAVLWMARPAQWGRVAWIATALAALLAAYWFKRVSGDFAPNYLSSTGEYSAVLSGSRQVLGPDFINAFHVVACLGGILLPGTVLQRRRAVDPVLGTFTVLTAVADVLISASGQGLFDRYLIALLPGTLAVILANRPDPAPAPAIRRSRWVPQIATRLLTSLGAATFAFVGLVAVLLAANAFGFDIARWHLAEQVARTGVPASRIDAGLEWLGWNSPDGVRYPGVAGGWGEEAKFSHTPSCVVLLPSEDPPATRHWTLEGSAGYRTFLLAGSSRLYVYATHAPDCRPPLRLQA